MLGLDCGCNNMLKERSLVVDLLAICFGIGTWVGVNSIFIQLPLLVQEAPEGWSLPSYLSVMVQFGNVGLIAYTVQQRCTRNNKEYATAWIYGLLSIGALSALLTAFFYNNVSMIFGSEHSVALLILTFFTAINACTSSVVFLPYMGRFKEAYLVTFFVGEGLSGLLPSALALIQGIGGEKECRVANVTETHEIIYEEYVAPPRFGTMTFFLVVFGIMVSSFVGFALLNHLMLAKRQHATVKVTHGNDLLSEQQEPSAAENKMPELSHTISTYKYWSLLILIGIVCFFSNGVFNSILSYSCLPYGNIAYHLSATLSVMANPVACFVAIFVSPTSLRPIAVLSGIITLLTAYVLVTAAMSPNPPLHGTAAGSVIVIITWTILVGLISYLKVIISAVMRSQGGRSLFWTGGLMQVGSLLGSVLIFVLINFTNSFKSYVPVEKVC